MSGRITRPYSAALVLVIAAGLAGCAGGLSQKECQLADWRAIGFEDGVKGRSQSNVGEHRKDCAEYGVALQLDEYRAGWQAGVQQYCQPGKAYYLGRNGKRYSGVCPDHLESPFLSAYADGQALYKLERDVSRLSSTLRRKHNRLASIDTEMRETGLELVADGVSTEHRIRLLDILRRLGEERNQTQAEIPELEAELADKRWRLEQLSSASAY